MIISIPVPVAELFDKISILEIKVKEIASDKKRGLAAGELNLLMEIVSNNKLSEVLNSELYYELKKTNEQLWEVCNKRRAMEHSNIFDDKFMALSRQEYKTNDRRAICKLNLNRHFKSTLVEVKSYEEID